MSDTPETDAFFFRTDIEWDDEVEFARNLERELDEANKELNKQLAQYDALFDEAEKIRMERDEARALVAEMKQAIIWAKAEAKERLHRLDQAACERRTWLEAEHKMKLERDEALKTAAMWEKIALREASINGKTLCKEESND